MAYVKILLRKATSTEWSTENPVLALGEPAAETDTQKMKIGDGVTPWNSLPYTGGDDHSTLLNRDLDSAHPQYALVTNFDSHTANSSIHFTEGSISHSNIQDLDANDHPQYAFVVDLQTISGIVDTHINDVTTHFTEASIDHGNIAGLADNDHPQYLLVLDFQTVSGILHNHVTNSSVHFTEGSIDHGSIAGLMDNDHPQYRLVADPIYPSTDLDQEGAVYGNALVWNGLQWVPSGVIGTGGGGGTTDHGALTGLGDNDHPQYRLVATDIVPSTDLAQDGAQVGEALRWNGSQWIPSGISATGPGISTLTDRIGFGMISNNTLSEGSSSYKVVPYNCNILGWYIESDQSGSVSVDVQKDLIAPTGLVGAGTKPNLSSQTNNNDSPIDWDTTALTEGDVLIFNIEAGATINKVFLTLDIESI